VPRTHRIETAGGIFHVTTRGVRKTPIFVDEHDRDAFVELLAKVVRTQAWKLHAYCLMTNHFHLLVETPDANLSPGMQRLNSAYAARFNRRHGFEGHVVERRFHCEPVVSVWHLLEAARYIVLNPVRAGLCLAPGSWEWSSYGATIGRARKPAFLTLDLIRGEFDGVQGGYEGFVADAPLRAVGR
jgi:REP-associated tyrosine transposase